MHSGSKNLIEGSRYLGNIADILVLLGWLYLPRCCFIWLAYIAIRMILRISRDDALDIHVLVFIISSTAEDNAVGAMAHAQVMQHILSEVFSL